MHWGAGIFHLDKVMAVSGKVARTCRSYSRYSRVGSHCKAHYSTHHPWNGDGTSAGSSDGLQDKRI